jgi:hypothetical protein
MFFDYVNGTVIRICSKCFACVLLVLRRDRAIRRVKRDLEDAEAEVSSQNGTSSADGDGDGDRLRYPVVVECWQQRGAHVFRTLYQKCSRDFHMSTQLRLHSSGLPPRIGHYCALH